MRLTEDGHAVPPDRLVFEILYRRLNQEISLAEPTCVMVSDTDRPIWKTYEACAFVCRKINDTPRWQPLTQTIPTIKLVADDSKRSKANH
jgi:hypothetical protein